MNFHLNFELQAIITYLAPKSSEMALTNNDIIKKLRVALKLRDDDIIEILGLVEYEIGKSELGAFFRNEEHPKYVELQDQILRNFLNGLVIYKRGTMEDRGKTPHQPKVRKEEPDTKTIEEPSNEEPVKEKRPRVNLDKDERSAQDKYGAK
ncbi:MAG: hypothetical protein ACI865_001935 [Flavobacteriaceae bacterium]|jgi:hypothetical protein